MIYIYILSSSTICLNRNIMKMERNSIFVDFLFFICIINSIDVV